MQPKRERYVERAKEALDGLNQQITQLEARAEVARIDAEAKAREPLRKAREQWGQVRTRLEDLQEQGGAALDDVRQGIEAARRDLEVRIEAARERIRKAA